MHEGVYTDQIAQAVLDALKAHPGAKVKKVQVKVGEMLHLMPDAVRMHFAAITQGGPLQGVQLDLIEVHVKVRCRACGHEGEPHDHHALACEKCSGRELEVLAGRGVAVESIDLETD
jgi:hydrogenase nickel incorporation protein HypA/HybF